MAAEAGQRMPAVSAAVVRGGEILSEGALLADVAGGEAATPERLPDRLDHEDVHGGARPAASGHVAWTRWRRPCIRILYEDGEAAIEFLTRAFGFGEVDRAIGGAGGLHAELEVVPAADAFISDSRRAAIGTPQTVGRTSLVHVLVDDVDAHFERACRAGATIVEGPTIFLGHRRYGCTDPQAEWYCASRRSVMRAEGPAVAAA